MESDRRLAGRVWLAVMQMRYRAVWPLPLAFSHQRTGARFALSTLRGHAEFELDFVKTHAHVRAALNELVADAMTDTDNHGDLLEEANNNHSH
jgi:hypothetical protein